MEYNIGFKEEPKDLDDFLRGENYVIKHRHFLRTVYNKEVNLMPKLYYYKPPLNASPGEVPDWKDMGIVAEIEISHTTHEAEEAGRIAKALMRHYNAIFFDGKDYMTGI